MNALQRLWLACSSDCSLFSKAYAVSIEAIHVGKTRISTGVIYSKIAETVQGTRVGNFTHLTFFSFLSSRWRLPYLGFVLCLGFAFYQKGFGETIRFRVHECICMHACIVCVVCGCGLAIWSCARRVSRRVRACVKACAWNMWTKVHLCLETSQAKPLAESSLAARLKHGRSCQRCLGSATYFDSATTNRSWNICVKNHGPGAFHGKLNTLFLGATVNTSVRWVHGPWVLQNLSCACSGCRNVKQPKVCVPSGARKPKTNKVGPIFSSTETPKAFLCSDWKREKR